MQPGGAHGHVLSRGQATGSREGINSKLVLKLHFNKIDHYNTIIKIKQNN